MELLLNLTWLLLAVPAYWLWRQRQSTRQLSSVQCLLALGCLLVILFPVISASDDLVAMRAEMEESPVSKRSMHQAGGDKAPLWHAHGHGWAALAGSDLRFVSNNDSWLQLSSSLSFPPVAPTLVRNGRAPPPRALLA
jgi:hypothetical protein